MPSLPEPNGPSVQKLNKFVIQWIKLTWPDLLFMSVLGLVTLSIYKMPVPFTRTFPITFTESGDIIYPEWAYPYRGWIIPSWISGLISTGIPMIIFVVSQIWIQSAWDLSNAVIGTIWANQLGTIFHVLIKRVIGGFRPYFLDVCMPDISLAGSHNSSGLNGVGYKQVMYTTEICTQPDPAKLKRAITSFPSGHSTAAFAGFIFLFLWLNAKLKVWADHKPAFWKLTLTMLPILAAGMIACSLTIDAAHNWYDIVGGSVIGISVAFASYRTSYAAIWDWRFNHLPLQSKEAFMYGFDGDFDYAAQTLSRSAGWGGRSVKLDGAVGSLFTGRTSSRQEIENLGTNGGDQPGTRRRVQTGDDAV
ncbi:Fc.00g075330.m01.CDS01 [Cosmosporella sp. VM-42]